MVQLPPYTGTRVVQSRVRDAPGNTQLLHGKAEGLGMRTRGLLLLLTHQLSLWLYLSLVPRRLPKRALEVRAKTNFAICLVSRPLPPAPSHLLPLFFAQCCKPSVAGSRPSHRPTAQPALKSLGRPTPGGRRGTLEPRPGPGPALSKTRPGHAFGFRTRALQPRPSAVPECSRPPTQTRLLSLLPPFL